MGIITKISVFRTALQFLYLLKFGSLSRNWEKQRCVALHYIDIFQGVSRACLWFETKLIMQFNSDVNNLKFCWHQHNLWWCDYPMTNITMNLKNLLDRLLRYKVSTNKLKDLGVGNFTFPTPQNRGQSDSPPFPRTALKSIQT